MDKFSYEILRMLRERLNKPAACYQIPDVGQQLSARQFYLEKLNDNLAVPMSEQVQAQYKKGHGNERDDKMKAIRSSSAMTYNIFRNAHAILDGTTYQVEYEKQFYTLKRGVSKIPAHLDAFLLGEDQTAIACEMKMMEWIVNAPSRLKEAYLHRESYQVEEKADIFIEVAKSLIAPANDYSTSERQQHEYASTLVQYDAFQMFKHTLALYNACRNCEITAKKLTLMNVVWECPFTSELSALCRAKYEAKLANEHNEFEVFYEAMRPIIAAFKDVGVDFDIYYCSVHDFISRLTLDPVTAVYLERYIDRDQNKSAFSV